MKIQYKNLQNQATNLPCSSNMNNKNEVKKKNVDSLFDEILVSHVELGLQNITLFEARSQLHEVKVKYAECFEFAPVEYFILNSNGTILEANYAASQLLGIQRDKLIKRNFLRYVAEESQFIFSGYQKSILEKVDFQQCEVKLLRRNESSFQVTLRGKVITDFSNQKKILLAIANINRNKNNSTLENDYNQEVVNSKNEFVLTMLNDINHPLCIVSNYIQGCIRRLEGGLFEARQLISAMKQAAEQLNHISKIIFKIKNFPHKYNYHYRLENINSIVEEAILLIEKEADGFPVEIKYSKNKNISDLFLDKASIQEVILNLSKNAIESMQDANVENPKLVIEVNWFDKNTIEICISDNGPGFPSKDANKLFENQFTTKSYGMGLGLSVSRKIIESHGGKLQADLKTIYGACFKFTLPLKAE